MTGRYKVYAETKNSNTEWLGEVPTHWVVSKFAYVKTVLTDYTANGSFADLKKNVTYKDEPSFARLVRLTDLRRDLDNDGVWIDEGAYNYLKKSALFGGEFLLANVGAYAGLFYQMPYNKGAASLAPNMFMAKFSETKILPLFMAYVGQCDPINKQLTLNATASSAQPKLNKDDFKSIKFCYPPLIEQQKIANFLDHETAKIDTLITKQEKLIELLKEKRQAVISHAVTKGISYKGQPNAPMKDSGVEWLGEVPEHWRIVKLSYFLKLLSGDGITSNQIEAEGKYPVMGGNGLRGFTTNYNCNGEYALIGRQGALCGNINLATGKFFASEHAVVVYPYTDFNLTFLSEFLRFMNLGQYSVSAAQPGISVERINGLKIAIPPLDEQTNIGDEIKDCTDKFDTLTIKAKTMIEALKERKTALISAAVTGKIDVRDWQPHGVQG